MMALEQTPFVLYVYVIFNILFFPASLPASLAYFFRILLLTLYRALIESSGVIKLPKGIGVLV